MLRYGRLSFIFLVLLKSSYGIKNSSSLIEIVSKRSNSYGHSSSDNGWSSPSSHGSGGGHSLFDIALTGLAFLSFGVFLLNLLLNALMALGFFTTTVLPTGTGTGIITTTVTGTGTGTGTGGITVTVGGGKNLGRTKRSPYEFKMEPISSIDALASIVLRSIDALVNEHECLEKVFCDGNKEAKVIGSGFQYLMPAYSMGASFIGKKIGLHNCIPNHLNSVLLGLQESNCQKHYPQC